MKNYRCVLLLNSDVQPLSLVPLSIVSWQFAIKNIFLGRLIVLESYDEVLRSQRHEIRIPSVVMLNSYSYRERKVKLTKHNLFLRDEYRCQYCSKEFFGSQNLTFDHVIPKSKGGKTVWENIVTSCETCNMKKKDIYIEPLKRPYVPSYYELAEKRRKFPITIFHETWNLYLCWDEDKTIHKKIRFR